MAIFDILKNELFIEQDEALAGETVVEEEGKSIEGDPQALVNGMIENAPGSKEQIGIILKYAANSIPDYDIWDAALDYFESLGDEEDTSSSDDADGAKAKPVAPEAPWTLEGKLSTKAEKKKAKAEAKKAKKEAKNKK